MDTDVNEQDEQYDQDERKEDNEKKLKQERYELAGRINESTNFIYSLVKRLSLVDNEVRTSVIGSMLVDEYLTARAMVDRYKELGGESYSIDRGMWRDVVGY